MQSKISAFFKSSSTSASIDDDDLSLWENTQHRIINTYSRTRPNPNAVPSDPKPVTVVKNKKRSYAQFHLDFGQSDFLLRECPTCGIKFTPGDPHDEKSHNEFHKSYTHGIQFRVNSSLLFSLFALIYSPFILFLFLFLGLDKRKGYRSTQRWIGSNHFGGRERPVFSQKESWRGRENDGNRTRKWMDT